MHNIWPIYTLKLLYLLHSPLTVLYAIVLHSNDEEHTVPLNQLENFNGLTLSKKDATIDAKVIWMYKGKTPYEATIVGIHTDKGKFV